MKTVANASILTKSLIAPAFAAIMILVIGVVFLGAYFEVRQEKQQQAEISAFRSELQGALLDLSSAHLETLRATSWKQSQVDDKLIEQSIATARKSLDKVQALLDRRTADPEQIEHDAFVKFGEAFKAYRAAAEQTLDAIPVDAFMALMFLNDTQVRQSAVVKAGQELLDRVVQADTEINQAVESALKTTLIAVLSTAGLAILLSLAAAVLLGRAISRPTTRLTAAMTRLTEGDTSVAIEGTERRDELGRMASAVQVFKENMIRNVELSRQTA
ncbi:HAMP domain-containing protein, partial [Tistlia consotensis]|uniref:HAMP domain-containing protein n=1 Tax=Tistlia consotensis TaxID=1321365 RepID=UPI000B62C97C